MHASDPARRRAAVVFDCLYPLTTGGAERVYRRMAELLVERGFAVDYVTREYQDAAALPTAFEVVAVWDGELYDAHGVRRSRGAAAFAVAVSRYFRSHRRAYDLVICSATPVTTLLAVRLALFGARRPMLVGDWPEVWPVKKWLDYAGPIAGAIAATLQWVAARTVRISTAASEFTATRLRRLAPRNQVLTLGLLDLIEDDGISPGAAAAPPYLMFLGRHIADKRLDTIPAALATARKTVPDLQAVILGDGPEQEFVRAEVHRLGLDDVCRFPGFVERREALRLLAGAAVLVNPSVREGFGLVIAEAASLGVPSVVVSGPENAAAELVESGTNGFIAESHDPAQLGGAIAAAVAAGAPLRASTVAWYETASKHTSLAAAIDTLISRLASSSSEDDRR